jgi:hypothetical protein
VEAGLYHRIQDRILLSKFYCKFIKRAENAGKAFSAFFPFGKEIVCGSD